MGKRERSAEMLPTHEVLERVKRIHVTLIEHGQISVIRNTQSLEKCLF